MSLEEQLTTEMLEWRVQAIQRLLPRSKDQRYIDIQKGRYGLALHELRNRNHPGVPDMIAWMREYNEGRI